MLPSGSGFTHLASKLVSLGLRCCGRARCSAGGWNEAKAPASVAMRSTSTHPPATFEDSVAAFTPVVWFLSSHYHARPFCFRPDLRSHHRPSSAQDLLRVRRCLSAPPFTSPYQRRASHVSIPPDMPTREGVRPSRRMYVSALSRACLENPGTSPLLISDAGVENRRPYCRAPLDCDSRRLCPLLAVVGAIAHLL
jgi:hypothetical protein